MKRTVILFCGLLTGVSALPAWADSKLDQEVQALQAQVNALTSQVNTLQTQLTSIKNNPVLALGPYVTVDTNTEQGLKGPHVIFYGANVHIVSGSGATVDNTGLGNLVIGYNEDTFNPSVIDAKRTGSHNLVLGPDNMFIGSGGLVAGALTIIAGKYATVTGGECNGAGPTESQANVTGGVSPSSRGRLPASAAVSRIRRAAPSPASAAVSVTPQAPLFPALAADNQTRRATTSPASAAVPITPQAAPFPASAAEQETRRAASNPASAAVQGKRHRARPRTSIDSAGGAPNGAPTLRPSPNAEAT